MTCSCGHAVIDHDGTGCTIGTGANECLCSMPVDELLDPPTPESAERTSWTVDELDVLHDRVGLGGEWRRSSARVDAQSKQGEALVFVYCGRCEAHALPHTHSE